jgi:hypothetical protein
MPLVEAMLHKINVWGASLKWGLDEDQSPILGIT